MAKKHFTKVLCCILTTVFTLGVNSTAFSAETVPKNNTVAPSPYKVNTALQRNKLTNITAKEQFEAKANGFEIIEKVTDPATIQQMVNNGLAEKDENGNLPTTIITYFAPDKSSNSYSIDNQNALLKKSGISVSKTNYFDGAYFDDYDRYKVDGPSEFETTYSKTGTSNWNCDMSGEVSIGGTIYSLIDVKSAVSAKMGYSFAKEYTKTQRFTVEIPKDRYWVIKVWVSYLVHEYTAKVNNSTLGTGQTWQPNGLIITSSEYKKK